MEINAGNRAAVRTSSRGLELRIFGKKKSWTQDTSNPKENPQNKSRATNIFNGDVVVVVVVVGGCLTTPSSLMDRSAKALGTRVCVAIPKAPNKIPPS